MDDRRTALFTQFAGLKLDGGGFMNDNQFMGLRIRFEGGG